MEKFHFEPKQKQPASKSILRTAAYCRVSTILEEQTYSFETQCSYYRQLIESDPGKVLVGIYGDRMSGLHKEKRPEFMRLVEDCENGLIDLVITKSVSRFSRNMADCISTVNRLKALNIPVIFEKEGVNSLDRNAELFLSVLAALAQEESGHQSRNLRWAQEHAAQLGRPIRITSYGYRQTKNREWYICPSEAVRVRRAYDMALEMRCYRDIIDTLNFMENTENTGKCWTQPMLSRMFHNEVYKGDLLTNKTYTVSYLDKSSRRNRGERPQYYIEEHHRGIVTADEFDRVLELAAAGLLHTGACRKRADHSRRAAYERELKLIAEGERRAANGGEGRS